MMKNIRKVLISLLVMLLLMGCGAKSTAGTKEDWDTLQIAIKNISEVMPMTTDGEVKLNVKAQEGKIDLEIPYVLEIEKNALALEMPNGIDLSDVLSAMDQEETSEMELTIMESTLELFKNSMVLLVNENKFELYVGGELLFDLPVEADFDDIKETLEEQTGQNVAYEEIKESLEKFTVTKSGADTIYNFTVKPIIEEELDDIEVNPETLNSVDIEIKTSNNEAVSFNLSTAMTQKDDQGKDIDIHMSIVTNYKSDKKVNIPNQN